MTNEQRQQLAEVGFKPFTEADWEAFSGCESEEPWIYSNDSLIIIMDGKRVCTYVDNSGEGHISSFDVEYAVEENAIALAILLTKQSGSLIMVT